MRIECPKFKKPDGTECYIVISIISDYSTINSDNLFRFEDVMYRNPPKRKWASLEREISAKLQHSRYNYDERHKIKSSQMKECVGEQALKNAMNYAWQYIKPSILKEDESNG